MPDITSLTAKVQADKDAVASAQKALDAANATLAADQKELDAANFINQIEALGTDPSELAVVQAALQADGSNVSISVAP